MLLMLSIIAIHTFVPLLDPIGMAGWIAAGFASRFWWQAALGASAWSLILAVVMVATMSYQPFSLNGATLGFTALGYSLAALLIFWVRRSIKARKAIAIAPKSASAL